MSYNNHRYSWKTFYLFMLTVTDKLNTIYTNLYFYNIE